MAAKEGKKGIGKIVLIVVVAIVVIGAIGSMGGKGGTDQAPAGEEAQTSEQQPAEETEPYTISDEQLDTSNQFAVYINGTLTNNTENEASYIQVEYNLYDADGAQVGTALANTNNLKAGGTWKFEAVGTASPDEVASYELVDVTGF
ncbi:DUF3426 domain-containing protein [Olsenella uli]|uniref:FxLYD domain-containing protein n=1 Tax=Olsenella uli TaxID=133926 RepID=UPI0019568B43|nr:FxLYD domain-containing protein [Olsenella uli]MBM6675632.1 DUF3426 domain-containing protein [Olsenella uli]